jgi:SAM-dependent methyltransferase
MDQAPASASAWVQRWAPLAMPGEVLDLACGRGRHARLFAALGHPVLAVDRDPAALAAAAGPGITTYAFDLEEPALEWPFAPGRFAAIVVTNYLHRPLMRHLLESLAPDGLLIVETFAVGNEQYGRPANPAFLLQHGELLAHAAHGLLRVLAFEDGFVSHPKPAMVQRIAACGALFAPAAARLDGAAPRETGQE